MSYILLDYRCRQCGATFESLEQRSAVPPSAPHACGGIADRTISPVKFRPQYGAVTTGKSEEPPYPAALDTRPLADGMSMSDFKAMRSKKRRDERRAWLKEQL